MLQIFSTYSTDLLLCLYIFGGLAVSSFIRYKKFTTDLEKLYITKKHFYLFMRAAILTLILHLLLIVKNAQSFFINTFLDSLNFLEILNKSLTNELGIMFFRQDFLSIIFIIIVNFSVLVYLLILLNFFNTTKLNYKYMNEVPILIVTVFLSLKVFLSSYDFITIIISLELATLCTIILLSLQLTTKDNVFPIEASIKYFLFNAVAMGFMLIGITGYFLFIENYNLLDFSLQSLLNPYFHVLNFDSLIVLHFFFFLGYLMKLGSAPFHQWVPDVYEGVEFILTAFLILVISPALNLKFFIFIKLLIPNLDFYNLIFGFFLLCGFLSIIIGVFNAIGQFKLKRFLAYASINHLGFILISLATPTFIGFFASLFYLFTYIFTNMAFFTIILMVQQFNLLTVIYLNQLKSLMNHSYFLFSLLLIPIFSFAGFPPFAGFFGKLFVFSSLLDFNKIYILIFIIMYVVINAYLYLRFIKISLFENKKFQFYIPVNFNYKKITTNYQLTKKFQFLVEPPLTLKTQLCFLFFINCFLFGFLIVLPTISVLCSQLILSLFLFF